MAKPPITVTVKDRNVRKAFKEFGEDAPFGIAETLTVLAASARKRLVSTLDDHFTIRNKNTAKGIIFKKAHRHSLSSHVGTTDDYLADHVVGLTRTAAQHRLSVAQVGDNAPRKSFADITGPAKHPGRLLAKDQAKAPAKQRLFLRPTKTGSMGIWRKQGRVRKGRVDPAGGIRLIYVLSKKVRVAKDWPMQAIVNRRIEERFDFAIGRGLEEVRRRIWSRNRKARK